METDTTTRGRICVIGGAGYVGTRLVPTLIERGYEVTVIDSCWFGNHLDASVPLIQTDIMYLDAEVLKGFSTVIFLAGLASDPMAEYGGSFNFVSNVAAPQYAAFIARQAGVSRFIFADSCSVYGDASGRSCNEADALRFLPYPYGVSKAQANLGLAYLASDTFSVISLRNGTVSGWSPRMRFDLLVNAMYKSASLDRKIIVNNPAISRPLLAIEDNVQGYVRAIEAPQLVSGTFNLASENVTVGGVATTIKEHFNRVHSSEVVVEMRDVKDVRDYTANTDKAHHELGFTPTESVESVLAGLDTHYGPSFDFNNDNYYNVRVFQRIFNTKTKEV
jgi:nucleoside-diphosphate-sugar epimerase